jgi:hypothetical protein
MRLRPALAGLGVLASTCTVAGLLPTAAAGNDYSDPAYAQHDADNLTRGRGAQVYEATTPSYTSDFAAAAADSSGRHAAKQLSELRKGRVYGGLSGYVPTYGGTGDPELYFAMSPRRVHFLSRTGAKLQGHVWGADGSAKKPGVVITPGSIQGSDQMYWWAAIALARAGYVVMTFDAQGQGQSETFGHEAGAFAPTAEGVPFQQEQNFVDGSVDALRFFLSTPAQPYVPGGWTAEQVSAARAAAAGEQVDWVNPGSVVVDPRQIGIAGHSLGARAVSVVQQCSDRGTAWTKVEACGGRSYPIKAVVGWDTLSESVTPVVPGLDLCADGYFLSPTAAPMAPDPTESLAAFTAWRTAKVDSQVVVVRAGTHLEFSHVPFHGPSTRYGQDLAAYYTVAWMDRYVPLSRGQRDRGFAALVGGPAATPELPHSANHFSVRRLSALAVTSPRTGRTTTAVDLRAFSGRSKVGDWVGANADTVGSEVPPGR